VKATLSHIKRKKEKKKKKDPSGKKGKLKQRLIENSA